MPWAAVQNAPLPPLQRGETIPIAGGQGMCYGARSASRWCLGVCRSAVLLCPVHAAGWLLHLLTPALHLHLPLSIPPSAEVELHQGKTSPPDYLTEAELIGLMEKHGIGTGGLQAGGEVQGGRVMPRRRAGALEGGPLRAVPSLLLPAIAHVPQLPLHDCKPTLMFADASIPVHINNICERNYVSIQSGRRCVPTELGITLIRCAPLGFAGMT